MKRKIIICVCIFFVVPSCIFAEKKDTTFLHNSSSVDLFPLYYNFFDYHKEIRVGISYDRYFKNHWLASVAIDCGMFNDYTFTKYFDFFNQHGGYYYIKQDIKITGFHLIPSGNYYLWQSHKKNQQGLYAGMIADFNYYNKNLTEFNSQTEGNNHQQSHQFRIGGGIKIGVKIFVGKHFFTEIKTSFLGKILLTSSSGTVTSIRPLNAHWTDANQNFWWVSNLNIGYAF